MNEYTPSLEEVRDATSLFRSRFFDYDEFDRWYQAEVAAAEQRGAVKALRDAAKNITEGYDPETDMRIFDAWDVREMLNQQADQMEGNDE